MNFERLALNRSRVSWPLVSAGNKFQSFGPLTAKESSYNVMFFADAFLGKGGITACSPFRSVSINWTLRSFGTFLFRILNIWMIMYLSLLR